MKPDQAIKKLREVIRRKHFALSTEESYCGWLVRFIRYLSDGNASNQTSNKKVEAFLSQLAGQGVAAATQNQAFNALIFFYNEVIGQPLTNVDSLRAKRPQQIRRSPSVDEVRRVLASVGDVHGYPTRLIVHLLYGCGLRVSEPCNLRIQDVDVRSKTLVIRQAKGGKDRVVAMPPTLVGRITDQIEAARVVWKRDAASGVPVQLPGLLDVKYPSSRFAWKWAWLFPSKTVCLHPRTGITVRWRIHETNVQRAVRSACRLADADFKPHELRHAYATHCLNRGVNPRAIQSVMGHASLETTMTYLHAESLSVPSPLEAVAA